MPPQLQTTILNTEHLSDVSDFQKSKKILPPRSYEIIWRNTIILIYMHATACYGFLLLFNSSRISTIIFNFLVMQITLLGVTAGAHRCWSHKAYTANLPLRVLFAFFQTVTYQEDLFTWIKNHRLHHKFQDDDADPYNPARGFFFAHIGWIMVKRHPRSIEKGRELDLSDILKDPVIRFQRKYFLLLVAIFCFIIPVSIPCYFFEEHFYVSWHLNMLRWALQLNATFTINSVAHVFGYKPYDRRIGPGDHWSFQVMTLGEGAHNFHHAFPWDYRSLEMDTFYFNFTTWFIDLMARLGWAYDLKTASPEIIEARARRTGNPLHRPHKIKF